MGKSILFYGYEFWTFLSKFLRISYWEHKTNEYINGTKAQVSWTDSNISSPLLSAEWCNGLAMPHAITASARQSCKALLMMESSGDGSAKTYEITSKSGRTWQCWDFWEPLLTYHPGWRCMLSLMNQWILKFTKKYISKSPIK